MDELEEWSTPRPRKSGAKPLLIGCGLLGLIGLLAVGGLVAWLVNSPDGGVKMANEMDRYALDYLQKNKILNGTEKLLAYYDETIAMSGKEAAILTTERLLYHKDGRTTALALRDIEDVRHRYETLDGDVIEARSKSGERMKIEIAPLNNGEAFLHALNEAREAARK